ncbi:hypothetical protein BKA69DRAFT_1125192 [Paraphysoderma sedebokerense]|nr:hypothetical protein BKA69DRAFT_1125192 [Paraphysoderma sedebokerense]
MTSVYDDEGKFLYVDMTADSEDEFEESVFVSPEIPEDTVMSDYDSSTNLSGQGSDIESTQSAFAGGAPDNFQIWLDTFGNDEFASFVHKCGISAVRVMTKSHRSKLLHQITEIFLRHQESLLYRYIVSIDIGKKNFSWITFDRVRHSVIDWRLFDVGLERFDPIHYDQKARQVMSEIMQSGSPTDYYFIVEKQNVKGSIESVALEYQLHSLSNQQSAVVPTPSLMLYRNMISANIISSREYFSKSYSERHSYRKAQAVALVTEEIEKLKFESEELVENFKHCDKKDDMADALIQMEAYLYWQANRTEYLNKFSIWNSGRV